MTDLAAVVLADAARYRPGTDAVGDYAHAFGALTAWLQSTHPDIATEAASWFSVGGAPYREGGERADLSPSSVGDPVPSPPADPTEERVPS